MSLRWEAGLPAQHPLDHLRGHEPQSGLLRRRVRGDSEPRSARRPGRSLHERLHACRRLCSLAVRADHGDVPDFARIASHAVHDDLARFRQMLSRVPSRGRLFLHEPVEDRLQLPRPAGGLGRVARAEGPWLDYMEKLPTMQEWRRLDAEGKLSGVQAFFMRDSKPVEELYDVQADPDEQVNLAGSPEHREVLARMRAAHFDWARQTLDLGLLPEQDMRDRARGSSEYEMARQRPEVFPFERIFETALLSGE